MADRPEHLFCFDDVRFEHHVADGIHPESPARIAAVRRGLVTSLREGGAAMLKTREARDEELLRVHTPEHVAHLERAFARGHGYVDPDTFFSEGSRTAARLAAGSAAELAERLLREKSAAGVLAGRPPGHHATRTRAMGFCLLNNVAVAAAAALEQGLSRVCIVDWDVHHGNGTQAIFEEDPRVLVISLHQFPLYPGTGRSDEIGTGAGRGRTINLPLPSASRGRDYTGAFRQVVLPAIAQFSPELLLVSSGFDAHDDDPLGGMALRDDDYGAFTRAVWEQAGQVGCHRLGLVLEGGYDLGALERASRSVALALLGQGFELEQGPVSTSAQRVIDQTRSALKGYFEL